MTTRFEYESQFSNWLAKNTKVVSDKVCWDIDPMSVQREVNALNGLLRVDLLCRATEPGGGDPFNVIIENQLTTTDSDHLTRMLAYAAAFDAKAVVWIATRDLLRYRRAIRWLNKNTRMDAYLFKLDVSDPFALAPMVFPGMPEEEELPQSAYTPNAGWRTAARTWFGRVLPKVAAQCEHLDVWQTQTTQDLRSPISGLMWCQQPVIHQDKRVSEYISWYIELHRDFVRIGLYIPNSPRDKSHYYFDALKESKADMDEKFGSQLETVVYHGGFKHLIWEPQEGVGYESRDRAKLEREAEAVANDVKKFIEATKEIVGDLTPYA